ncbi:MAG: hypothetical protein JNK94_08080 [Hyphomonadaceae bacterium]|nr:hypothetical protein [Hyphomonadaceae bacterium]
MSAFSLRAPSRRALRVWGFALAVASVISPALPLGPLFAQPPMPLAVLWAAYGWAAEDENNWRAPLVLALLGLVHDAMSGGPFGMFVVIYVSAYMIGRVAAVVMSAPNLISLWGGFIVTALLTIVIAHFVVRWGLGPRASAMAYAEAAVITAIVFPLVRPLYMSATQSMRPQPGARR